MKTKFASALLVALCMHGASSEAALSGRDTNKLRQADSQLTQLDKRLDEAAKFGGRANDIGTTNVIKMRVEAKFTECAERIEKAKAILGGLPASEPEVIAATARLDEAVKRVNAAKAGWNGQAEKQAQEVDALNTAVGDGSALNAMEKVFAELRGMRGDMGKSDEVLAMWAPAKVDFDKFNAQFGTSASRAGNSGARQAATQFALVKDVYMRVDEERKELAKTAPGIITSRIEDAKKSATAIGTATANFMNLSRDADTALERAERMAATYDVLCSDLPEYQAGFREKAKAATKQVDAEVEKFREKIIAQNLPISNTYTGADRAALENILRDSYKREHADEKVLSVRFTSDWGRTAGYRWEQARTAWEKYDHSTITAIVYVQGKDPAQAYARREAVRKWHLEGDKTGALIFPRAFPGAPPPSMVVLAKTLK